MVRAKNPTNKTFDAGEWLTADGTEEFIRQLAYRHAKFSRVPVDDLSQEIVLAVLEQAASCVGDPTAWVTELADRVAGKLRTVERNSMGIPTDTDVLAVTVAEEGDGGEPEFEYCEDKVKNDKARAARVKRALAKLSKDQREAIRDRFFKPTGVATTSTERMRLLRAKHRLSRLITRDAYAVVL